jgi:3',5'-cyclic AMP phosphodiesterase CpdA
VLDALERDLLALSPDHIAVTGDLINISLPVEFRGAAEWLDRLGPADKVTVIPGNHDAYVGVPWEQSWALWSAYMSSETSDRQVLMPTGSEDFPLVRYRGPMAIVGLSTALATAPGLATGKLGARQVMALEDHLHQLADQGLFRVVLVHHPPLAGSTKPRKSLVDAESFRRAIEVAGAELVLHGHNHRPEFGEIMGPKGPVPVVGVASASALPVRERPGAQYHVYELGRTDDVWALTMHIRVFDLHSGEFIDAGARKIAIPG